MAEFMKELGVSEKSFGTSFRTDTDWTLIIKLNAFLEGSLNYLLTKHLDSRLADIITRIEISDPNKGKLAFVKALDLLPKEHRCFIRKLCEIRNKLAHDVKNVDFNLKEYIGSLDSKKLKEIKEAVIPLFVEHFLPAKLPENQAAHNLEQNPRLALFICVAVVMHRVYEKKQIQNFFDLPAPPSDVRKFFLASELAQSSTKAQ